MQQVTVMGPPGRDAGHGSRRGPVDGSAPAEASPLPVHYDRVMNAERTMFDDTTLARIGALVGDPGRARMLAALLDGRALTAAELAAHAGVTAPTASGHLAKLVSTGLVRMRRQGRHRYHSLASPEVAGMLETMSGMAAALDGLRVGGPLR